MDGATSGTQDAPSDVGSKSGFDSVEECYGDLTPYIFAVETGLSSDPPMNWRVSLLDRYRAVSYTYAHPRLSLDGTRVYFEDVTLDIATGEIVAKGTAESADRPVPGPVQLDHISFNLPDERSLEALQQRLKEHGCEVTDVVDHQVMRSIYFTDPNGIALEASWWVADPTGRPVDYADERFFADPDPVDAVKELRDTGTLAWTPRTISVFTSAQRLANFGLWPS